MPESFLAVVLALILLFGLALGVLRQVGLGRTTSPFIDEHASAKDQREVLQTGKNRDLLQIERGGGERLAVFRVELRSDAKEHE